MTPEETRRKIVANLLINLVTGGIKYEGLRPQDTLKAAELLIKLRYKI